MYILDTINESAELSDNISEIISCNEGMLKKSSKLNSLRSNAKSPLAKAKADYYIKELRSKQFDYVKSILLEIFSILYFVFNLLRIWWYYYPSDNPLPESDIELIDLFKLIYLLPIIAALHYGVKKLIIKINKSKKHTR